MHRHTRRVLATLTVTLCLSPAGTAVAAPDAGDARATAVAGTVKTCRSATVPGDIVAVTGTLRENTFLDITAVPDGYQVLGVVVQGASSYNTYANLGALPWKDLRAPVDGPATITNWFACAKPRPTPTTTTPVTTTTTTTVVTTATTPETTTSASAPAVVTSTSASAVVAQPPQGDDLARTGFGAGAFLIVATLLILAGAVILVVVRRRHTIQPK
nr:hypothetical protein [Kibdelosporangium sp. MJ126-NF4]CEL22274.1 hypothetical protein [Kibdelosporangium sp. MJ126-NF4]CTQ93056.1 hypothetical protein [Kibdelosporangium sp. MJ126-NF4]